MKNLLNNVSNGNSLVNFQNLAIDKQEQKQLKGGEDGIIIETVDM